MVGKRSSLQIKRFVLCFSPKDADGKAELLAHLSTVRGTLDVWSVDDVSAGESVAVAFLRATACSDAALLLLSSDFFAELAVPAFEEQIEHLCRQQAARGLSLIPILWRDCDWRAVPWLAGCEPLPRYESSLRSMGRRRRDRALAEIVQQLCVRTKRVQLLNEFSPSKGHRKLGLCAALFAAIVIICSVHFTNNLIKKVNYIPLEHETSFVVDGFSNDKELSFPERTENLCILLKNEPSGKPKTAKQIKERKNGSEQKRGESNKTNPHNYIW